MKTPARPRDRGVRSAMTPLIDVVFILLIFFLVASHVTRADARLPVELPEARSAGEDGDPPGRVVVTVDREGGYFVEETPRSAAEVVAIVSAGDGTGSAAVPSLLIRADRAATYSAVEPLLAACVEAGVDRVDIAADAVAGESR